MTDPYANEDATQELLRISKWPEPLRLAYLLEKEMLWPLHGRAADELRRLHAIEAKLAEQPAQQEPCGWQFYQDGKWHNGMETNNHRANTEAAGVPVRDVYPSPQPAQQEPVPWPAGLIERIKSAEQRIQDGHAPRRIPADPTDVDLVLAEVRYFLEGKQPPFWVNTTPQPAQRTWVGLTLKDREALRDQFEGWNYPAILVDVISDMLRERNQ